MLVEGTGHDPSRQSTSSGNASCPLGLAGCANAGRAVSGLRCERELPGGPDGGAFRLPNDCTAIHCRVSSHDQKQKGDLARQKLRVLEYCAHKQY